MATCVCPFGVWWILLQNTRVLFTQNTAPGAHANTDLQRGTGRSVPCPCLAPVFSPPCRQWPCTCDLKPGGECSGWEARSADSSTPACGVHSSQVDSAECPPSPVLTVNLEAKGPDDQAHPCLQRAWFPVRTKDSSKETGTCSDCALTTET